MQFEIIVLAVYGFWLVILSAFLLYLIKSIRFLIKDAEKGNLISLLEKVLREEKIHKHAIRELSTEIKRLEEEAIVHIQKVGIVRFNPFQELGGEHSFSIALLDGNNDGIIFTGLHARERTRIYVKLIKKSKSELDLSEDEKKVLNQALKK